jgi:hypothetical protein
MTIPTRSIRYLATPDEREEPDDLPTFMVTVELAGGGKPRRRVATICRARARDRDSAERIALDVNEDEPHAYLVGARKIAELQIVHPLTWSPRGELVTDD